MILSILIVFFLVAGIFFFWVGTVGLLRLPDVFTRMHATTKCDTLGVGLVLFALCLHAGISFETAKLLLIIFFIWMTNPTATHVIARAAYRAEARRDGVKSDD